MKRTIPIDLLRGFIMILMALDHASAFVARKHFFEMWGVPFEGYETWGWWFTRFVSHLCAPGFFFLMGMSMYLFATKRTNQSWTPKKINQYFFKRGGLILALMLFIEFPAWIFGGAFSQVAESSAGPPPVPGQFPSHFFMPSTVLFGLGMCMILGALLWRMRSSILVGITILCFALSQWYIGQAGINDAFHPLETIFLVPSVSNLIMVIYPVIPWLGLTTFGMFCGQLLQSYPKRFFSYALGLGLFFLLGFVISRYIQWGNFQLNGYEDGLSFMTLIKYPPSINFALITCGINLVLLFCFYEMAPAKWLHPLLIFGQTAMFFYLAHLYLYGIIGIGFPMGSSLPLLYLMWAIGLVPLYFLCRWYIRFKKGKEEGSIWRMV